MICEYCNIREATHFCSGCGHWVCSNVRCNAAAIATATKRAAVAVRDVLIQR